MLFRSSRRSDTPFGPFGNPYTPSDYVYLYLYNVRYRSCIIPIPSFQEPRPLPGGLVLYSSIIFVYS